MSKKFSHFNYPHTQHQVHLLNQTLSYKQLQSPLVLSTYFMGSNGQF
jgi:hypothetical protein